MGDKTRTRYVSWRGKIWQQLYGIPGGSAVQAAVYPYGYTRFGSTNYLYRKVIKEGNNATGSLTVQVSNARADDLSAIIYKRATADPSSPDFGKLGSFGHEGVFLNVNLPLPISSHTGSSDMSKACSIAVGALTKKITRRRRQVQGLVVGGELYKTLSMVFKPAKALRAKVTTLNARVHRMVRKRVSGTGPSAAKIAADLWLEAVFGWKPLLADVKDGAVALARIATKSALEKEQFRAYGSHEVPSLTAVTDATVAWNPAATVAYKVHRVTSNRSECIIYGRFSTRIPDAVSAGSAAVRLIGLSVVNWEDLVPQVWELIPYSFLVDYFTNVGDVLEGFANIYHGIQWAAEVHIVETKDFRNFVHNEQFQKDTYGLAYAFSSVLGATSETSYKVVSRTPTTLTDIYPTLRFRLPVDMQWLNIAALKAGGRPLQPFLK